MSLTKKILQKFWEECGKTDQARLAGQTPTGGLVQINDIPYIDDGMCEHLLDIYYPEGTTEPLPVIIDIHGGGWMYGDKELNKNYALKLSSKGFLVANISYRLVGNYMFDDQLRDVLSALRWLGDNLKNYPADLDNVFLTGDSAGGHLACVSTAINLSEELRAELDIEPIGLDFKAVGATSPAIDLTKGVNGRIVPVLLGKAPKKSRLYKLMCVTDLVTDDFPPFYILTSSGDMVRKHAYMLSDSLSVHHIEHKLHDFTETLDGKKLQHVFSVTDPYSEPGDRANTEMTDFFKAHMTVKI